MTKAKTKKIEVEGLGDYELEAWEPTFGSSVVERVAHEDLGQAYEVCAAHVLKLANNRYALVTELGCSCYEPREATIDLHPNKRSAMAAFEKWRKENSRI